MKEEEIRKLAEDYIDSCTKKSGFVILAESLKGDFIDLFVAGFMKCLEINKTSKWHYVKDRDYPKDNKPVLCILGDIDSDSFEVGYYNDVGSGGHWHFETYYLPDDDGDNAWGVSAWKEIVLPEQEG